MFANLSVNGELTITTIIAVIALGLSVFNTGWTLYKDTRRSKLSITAQVARIHYPNGVQSDRFLEVVITNIGPSANRSGQPFCQKSWFNRHVLREKWSHSLIIPDYGHPAATPSNETLKTMDVGNSVSFCYPYDANCFLKNPSLVRLGVKDSYGNTHFLSRKRLKRLRADYMKDFELS